MDRRICRLALLTCLAKLSAAGTIISLSGPDAIGQLLTPDSSYAVSWTQTGTYTGVEITALLDSSQGIVTTGSAFVTNDIGPGTTIANQIASGVFQVTNVRQQIPLFTNLTLGSGTYYLVLASAASPSPVTWDDTLSPSVITDSGVSEGPMYSTNGAPQASYIPATSFGPLVRGIGSFQFDVTGASAQPEPGSAALFFVAAGVLALRGRLWNAVLR
jgi:hypothetical protein